MYGAQHDFILDDRDVNEYNKNWKFEQFTHLRQDIQKLIVYSTVETILWIDRANIWRIWTPGEPEVDGYAFAVREGMNIICLCHTRDSVEWPEPYLRVTVELRGPGLISQHPTPDLDSSLRDFTTSEESLMWISGKEVTGVSRGHMSFTQSPRHSLSSHWHRRCC